MRVYDKDLVYEDFQLQILLQKKNSESFYNRVYKINIILHFLEP